MHQSVKLTTPCEFINVQALNPLISKCQIKVCYVGEQPNRNKSIITKEVATKMASSLPGSPIVGYFNENKKDFEEHNRTIDISNGKFEMKDTTKPYGFVPTDAKVWFQMYRDDGMNDREYLCTEGYLWTGQYPECQRVIDKGNNQSMELDNNNIDAYWTKDENEKPQFFIINEAIVSKLCILGEECEPCFEGSSVTRPEPEINFSLGDDFKAQLFSMMQEIKDLLVDNKEEGGARVFTRYSVEIGDSLWNALYNHVHESYSIEEVCEDGDQKFAILKNSEGTFSRLDFSLAEDGTVTFAENVTAIEYTSAEEAQFSAKAVEAFVAEFKKKADEEKDKKDDANADKKPPFEKKDDENQGKSDKSDDSNSDNNSEGDKSDSSKGDSKEKKDDKKDDEDDKKKKKTNFSLDEIPEYVELSTKFADLESKYNTLVAERENLKAQLQPLVEFKAQAERTQKEEMIKSFYMLSDEDKADVVANIDTYSLDDIEAKLSIICVRNKISFNLNEDKDSKDPMIYHLGSSIEDDASTPAWVREAIKTAEKLK